MARSVYVVPHTHWDREWYDPYPTFRLRLVDMLDELLPRLDADPGFAHFQLDGQMAVVDDYLEVRPDEADRLGRLTAQGRLSMGPWYVLPDEFLVSGETLVRDLQLGISTAERFGGAMDVGYLPDMFGHIAAMPQLLQLFGLDHAVVWRGVPYSVDAPAFWWQSPDGSRVRAEYLSAGYGNGSNMPDNADELAERIGLFIAFQGSLVGDEVLWMAGMDHEVPPAHLSRVVAELNARSNGDGSYALTVGPLSDYLAAAPTDGLDTHHGELRSGARANLLMGVASNRVDVKIAAAAVAERSLERLAEPLLSLWSLDPRRSQSLLDLAWLEVIRNAAHDSICACSHDEVVDAVLHRYAEATRTATGLTERAITEATSRLGSPGVHVLNPGARDRNEVVEIEIPAPSAGGPDADDSLQVLHEFPAQEELHRTPAVDAPIIVAHEMIYEHPATAAVRIEDGEDGEDVGGAPLLTVHLLQPGEDHSGSMSTSEALGEIGQRCVAEPELVVRTVLHRTEPSRRTLAMSGHVAGYGWAPWRFTAPEHPVSAEPAPHHGARLDNGLVSIEVDPADGTFSIDGIRGYGRPVDGGDAGDTYNWCPPEPDVVVDRPDAVTVTVLEQGPLRARVRVDAVYTLPYQVEEFDDGARRRTGESRVEIRTTLELRADEAVVRIETTLDNHVRDHRLRVHLPLPTRADRSVAECAFALVERPLFAEGGPNEWGVPTYPSRRFVEAGGLTVTHEGLCEYELVDLDGEAEAEGTTAGELALTLVRSSGWLSRGAMPSRPLPAGPEDRLEGAQMQKAVTLRYAIALGEVDPYELAERVWVPLTAVSSTGEGDLPPAGCHLRVRGAEVDAVLTDDEGALVVRVHEPFGTAGAVQILRGDDDATPHSGTVIDLRGRPVAAFDGRAELRPHQILTVRLDD